MFWLQNPRVSQGCLEGCEQEADQASQGQERGGVQAAFLEEADFGPGSGGGAGVGEVLVGGGGEPQEPALLQPGPATSQGGASSCGTGLCIAYVLLI